MGRHREMIKSGCETSPPSGQKSPYPLASGRPTCPSCHRGGYSQDEAPDKRPRFTCGHCGNVWTCGKDGGEYVKQKSR
jgi:transposase-like protein